MGSKMQTGLLLVIGTISAAIGWMVLYPADSGDGAAAIAQAILNDTTPIVSLSQGTEALRVAQQIIDCFDH